jgi:hypothetical protein
METSENRNDMRNHWHHRRPRGLWIALGIVGFTALAFLFGAIIMWLWNGLMPDIFHLGLITYWQGLGLAILGRLIFGGFHHGGMHRRGHGPWMHRRGMGYEGRCRGNSPSTKWSYYEQYWNEEGENAFNEYVKRKNPTA